MNKFYSEIRASIALAEKRGVYIVTDKWDQFTEIDGVLYEPENNNTWIKPPVFHIYSDHERANVYANHRPTSKA